MLTVNSRRRGQIRECPAIDKHRPEQWLVPKNSGARHTPKKGTTHRIRAREVSNSAVPAGLGAAHRVRAREGMKTGWTLNVHAAHRIRAREQLDTQCPVGKSAAHRIRARERMAVETLTFTNRRAACSDAVLALYPARMAA